VYKFRVCLNSALPDLVAEEVLECNETTSGSLNEKRLMYVETTGRGLKESGSK
jgi:hypothetical protein